MKRIATIITMCAVTLGMVAQELKVQNKPYIDFRPLHFGILVGMNFQDIEFQNVGMQTVTLEDGTQVEQLITCDADKWNPGFNVGVLADLRLGKHFSLRLSPSMFFGAKHLVFRNFNELDELGNPMEITQDLKNTYLAFPLHLKMSAERFNNYRPYITAGINYMVNLTGKDQDIIQLKRTDFLVEVGIGCDFYLRYFKLIPELKFCYSLGNSLDTNHPNELTDVNKRVFATSVDRSRNQMFVFTLYFE